MAWTLVTSTTSSVCDPVDLTAEYNRGVADGTVEGTATGFARGRTAGEVRIQQRYITNLQNPGSALHEYAQDLRTYSSRGNDELLALGQTLQATYARAFAEGVASVTPDSDG